MNLPKPISVNEIHSIVGADKRALEDEEERNPKSACFAPSGGVSFATPPIVSHVPHSKVSVTETNSAESSIASELLLPCEPPSKHSIDGSVSPSCHQHQDSPNDESFRGERISAQIRETNCYEEKTTRRKVSLSDYDERGPSTKKPRILPTNEQTEIVRELQRVAPRPSNSKVMLLAQPMDASVLSPLHVFVRRQVEVFTATEADITQPAPGRKNRIQLHQVGLRCIHCADLASRDRVKRAVCYPSGVGRVYHSVSDMKFDHFTHCKGLPADIRSKFQDLKEESKQKRQKKSAIKMPSYSSSSTAQYYHDSARELGMVDAYGGLFMAKDLVPKSVVQETSPGSAVPTSDQVQTDRSPVVPILPKAFAATKGSVAPQDLNNRLSFGGNEYPAHAFRIDAQSCLQNSAMMSSFASFLFSLNTAPLPTGVLAQTSRKQTSQATTSGGCLLTSSKDQHHLNPLHCFVRRHIELFVADKADIAAPAPGRKTRVVLGQVGLRCIHCACLPLKDRVKRAVCYPAAVSGIYHSVSNMKFDHFDKCRGLPEHERAIFATLRSSCGRHGPRSGAGKGTNKVANANSTAQYYHDSALSLGLADSETGIRFQHTLMPPPVEEVIPTTKMDAVKTPTMHDEATDGISALMIAASVRAASASRDGQA